MRCQHVKQIKEQNTFLNMIKVHFKIFERIKISFLATTRTNNHTLTTLSTIVFDGTASQEEYTGKYLFNKIYVFNYCSKLSMTNGRKHYIKYVTNIQQIQDKFYSI